MKIAAWRGRALFAAWLTCMSTVAWADEHPTLGAIAVTLPYKQQSSGTEATLQAIAAQAVLRNERFDGRDLVDQADPQGAATRREGRGKAAARFQAGREAYDGLDLDKAAKLFGESADLYRETDSHSSFDDYLSARLWHAASRFLNGDKTGAQKEFTRIFVQAPRVVLDKQAFPPDLLAAAERARAVVVSDLSFSMTVSSSPAGLAWVDGRLAGPTPATVNHLAPGEHNVVVATAGYQPANATTSSAQAQLTLTRASGREDFETARSQVAAAFLGVDRTPQVAAVARSLGLAQLLVVVAEDKRSGTLHLLRVTADGRPLAAAEGNSGADPVEELSRLLPQVLGKDAPDSVQKAMIASERRTGQSSAGVNIPGLAPWFGGAALVLAVGSTVFGVLANHDRNLYAQTDQLDTATSHHLASVTSTNAVVADVFGITAGVVAVTAASFYFTPGLWGWHPRPTTDTEVTPDKPKKDRSGEDDLRESFMLVPVVEPNGGGVLASARF